MGKINMNNKVKDEHIGTHTDEQAVTDPIPTAVEHPELVEQPKVEEPTPNESENTAKAVKSEEIVIVNYIGGGAWVDEKGYYWANENKSETILCERQYSKEEYEKREDIKFMVAYGAMKRTTIMK